MTPIQRERERVTLRLAVYSPWVRLDDKHLETHDQYFFQLNTCGHSPYVTFSLTRGWVCRLQFLLVLASAVILRSKSRGTHDHILLFPIQDSPKLGGTGTRIYIPQEQGGPIIPPGGVFPFLRLLRLAGLRWRYSNPSSHRILSTKLQLTSSLFYNKFARTKQKILFPIIPLLLLAYQLPRKLVYRDVSSGSTIPDLQALCHNTNLFEIMTSFQW
jgi:hypothetical protein